jgi:hypothetical protein
VHDGDALHPAFAAHWAAGEVDPCEPMHERADGFAWGIGRIRMKPRGHCDRSVKQQTLAQALEWVWKD